MILHAIPSFISARDYGAGNWKAVEATRIALRRTGLPVRTVQFDWRDPGTVMPQVTPEIRHLLVEYSGFPNLLRQLQQTHPNVGLHVRAHNAEAYQFFQRATGNGIRSYASPRVWSKWLRLLWRDARCRQAADTLMGISEWDNGHYWHWLWGKAAVRYFPYHSPWPYLRAEVAPRPWALRQRAMVSMGGNFDPSGMANVGNFEQLALKISGVLGHDWSFLLTWWSQWHQAVPKVAARVEVLRDCREPWDLLCQVRALAVLTPLGFGLKTTVVDGLAAGCHVIVHPRLARRLPRQVADLCYVCAPSRAEDVTRLAGMLSTAPKTHRLNQQLCDTAVDVLRSAFERAQRGPCAS